MLAKVFGAGPQDPWQRPDWIEQWTFNGLRQRSLSSRRLKSRR